MEELTEDQAAFIDAEALAMLPAAEASLAQYLAMVEAGVSYPGVIAAVKGVLENNGADVSLLQMIAPLELRRFALELGMKMFLLGAYAQAQGLQPQAMPADYNAFR